MGYPWVFASYVELGGSRVMGTLTAWGKKLLVSLEDLTRMLWYLFPEDFVGGIFYDPGGAVCAVFSINN